MSRSAWALLCLLILPAVAAQDLSEQTKIRAAVDYDLMTTSENQGMELCESSDDGVKIEIIKDEVSSHAKEVVDKVAKLGLKTRNSTSGYESRDWNAAKKKQKKALKTRRASKKSVAKANATKPAEDEQTKSENDNETANG